MSMQNQKNPVQTHKLCANIMEIFDDFLNQHNIRIPCKDKYEEKEREPDNIAALYGTEYNTLFDRIEEEVVETLEKENIKITAWTFE